MKPTFHAGPVNNPFEDPCVYARILRERRAILFDVGDIGRLAPSNLLKVTDIFVTHTHIDHFIGFDTVLRNVLRRDVPLRLFGPASIIECVEGKLGGYTWNLIHDYPLKIEVFEVRPGTLSHASFYAENSFRRLDNPDTAFEGTLLRDPLFRVTGAILSHDIPVMAYSLEEEYHLNINKALLQEMGLPVGPWLSRLKRAIRERYRLKKPAVRSRKSEDGQEEPVPGVVSRESEVLRQDSEGSGIYDSESNAPNPVFEVGDRVYTLGELMRIVTITKGQKISYVMDVSPMEENLEEIIPLVRGSDLLFCEAYFLERDRDRAEARNHLTAALAGRIAREAGVGNLVIMHVSPKYRDSLHLIYEESMREFRSDVWPITSGI